MRKSLYAKIHVAKKQQGLDEETYRAFLQDITGKDSLKLMNFDDLQSVIKAFTRAGFVAKKVSKPKVETYLQIYINKIGALLAELGRVRKGYVSWAYANTILAQMYNIPTWQTAKREHLQGIIVALTKQLETDIRHRTCRSLGSAEFSSQNSSDALSCTGTDPAGARKGIAVAKQSEAYGLSRAKRASKAHLIESENGS